MGSDVARIFVRGMLVQPSILLLVMSTVHRLSVHVCVCVCVCVRERERESYGVMGSLMVSSFSLYHACFV